MEQTVSTSNVKTLPVNDIMNLDSLFGIRVKQEPVHHPPSESVHTSTSSNASVAVTDKTTNTKPTKKRSRKKKDDGQEPPTKRKKVADDTKKRKKVLDEVTIPLECVPDGMVSVSDNICSVEHRCDRLYFYYDKGKMITDHQHPTSANGKRCSCCLKDIETIPIFAPKNYDYTIEGFEFLDMRHFVFCGFGCLRRFIVDSSYNTSVKNYMMLYTAKYAREVFGLDIKQLTIAPPMHEMSTRNGDIDVKNAAWDRAVYTKIVHKPMVNFRTYGKMYLGQEALNRKDYWTHNRVQPPMPTMLMSNEEFQQRTKAIDVNRPIL